MTLIEKILAAHSKFDVVKPGEIIDIDIDTRVARDFGGADVVKNIKDFNLKIENPAKTFFTFDFNLTGSDKKSAINQHICRQFAQENGIEIYDIDKGIGTHLMIDKGLAFPGSTAVTTDLQANILGAIGAFGQGMGTLDIAAAWNKGKVWFKVPSTVKINLNGEWPEDVKAKDIVLNLLDKFGANSLMGYAVEICGDEVERFTVDERITISSMGTEMGCIIVLFKPNKLVLDYCSERTGKPIEPIEPDVNAHYDKVYDLDLSSFTPRVSKPGTPYDTVTVNDAKGIKIDSAFIGSCSNGRIQDMRAAANVLEGRQVAPGVVLKIVPATNEVWQHCLNEGLIQTFKNAGAVLSNSSCTGCAAGQVGQNESGEITISSGNSNFPGKQGKGKVYLASPAVVAASAVAGVITMPNEIPDEPVRFTIPDNAEKKIYNTDGNVNKEQSDNSIIVEGRVWFIEEDNIDIDMIFHNRYLSITDLAEMGQYTFENLAGYEDFSKKAKLGDIVVVKKNFGSGSSRRQAVDCFKALGISAIVAESYCAMYERNAINSAFPIVTYNTLEGLDLKNGDTIKVNFETGEIESLKNSKKVQAEPFSEVQLDIYQNGGLF